MTPVREALERLLTTAKLLQQNAEGCATNHYGHDCELNGLPGWLADTQKDIIAAQESLSAAPGEPCAWVKRLADNWRGRRDSLTGDSVRDSCADELEKVAACHATPQPAAGRSNDKRNIIQDAIIRCPSFSDLHRAPDLCAYDLADDIIKALRREAPAPAEGVDLKYQNSNWVMQATRPDTAETRLREHCIRICLEEAAEWDSDDVQTLKNYAGHCANRIAEETALSPPSGGDEAKGSEGGTFQSRVQPWMMACFGPEISADRTERNHRFLEEALELVQSNGCTPDEAHQLVDYVYGRPQGEINQEVGGVMVTLAALCLANGIDMHKGGETELARVWTKVEQIRAKQAAKPKHSPLPGPSEPLVGRREEQLRIQALGAAISRRDWHAAERAYEIIRDKFDRPSEPSPPADRREIVAHQAIVLTVANHLFLSPEFKHYHKSVAARADAAKVLATAALDGGR